jgi:hypothetical protein
MKKEFEIRAIVYMGINVEADTMAEAIEISKEIRYDDWDMDCMEVQSATEVE